MNDAGEAGRPAVFLDRDGTLIEHVPYLADPAGVRLLPGVAEALGRLGRAGFARVVVSNQSGVGRGMMTAGQVEAVHAELLRQLAESGSDAGLEGIYYCPAAPGSPDHPDRKPRPGLLRRAAVDLGLDLGASWMIGDEIRDVLAGRNAGCRGSVLVRTGPGANPGEVGADAHTCDDLLAAIEWILGQVGSKSRQ